MAGVTGAASEAAAASPARRSLRLPSVETMFVAAILLVAIAPAVQPVTDPDFFWHLQVGRWILDHGAIPHQDLFTFTVPDHAFIAHEWLSEVIMAALTNAAGLTGPALFFGIVTWVGFYVLLKTPRQVAFLVAGLSLAIGMVAGSPIFGPRTQMITFALTAILLLMLRHYRETGDRRVLYVLPPMFVLWVNLHAGFTIGLIFLYITILGELVYGWFKRRAAEPGAAPGVPLRPLVIATLLSTAAVAINPNFYNIYLYAAQTQFSSAQQQLIVEWFSPDFHRAELRPFEVMFVLVIVLLAFSPRKPRLTDTLLLLSVIVLSLQSVRHIALFVVVAIPITAELLQGLIDAHRDRLPRFRLPRTTTAIGAINLLVLLLVAGVMAWVAVPKATAGFRSPLVTKTYPVAAVDYIENDPPPGHMFNNYGWGGYLVYRLWPGQSVFVYGDAAVMGDPFLREYQAISVLQPNYLDILNRRGVTWILYPTRDPFETVMAHSQGWVQVFQDNDATLLVKRTPETQEWLARHAYP
jgi:hypothetical protein